MLSRRLLAAGFGCLPLFLGLTAATSPPPPAVSSRETAAINWRTDYETARREAQQSGKPLFVVFRCER